MVWQTEIIVSQITIITPLLLVWLPLEATLPDGAKHGSQSEKCGHGHRHPAGDGLGGQEEGEPGNDDKEAAGEVGLEEVVVYLSTKHYCHYYSRILA